MARGRKSTDKPTGSVSVKGTKEGLVVTIGEGKWPELLNQLAGELQEKAAFFNGAQAILDLRSREVLAGDLRRIGELFSANGMEIWRIRTSSAATTEAAAVLDIPTERPPDNRAEPQSRFRGDKEPEQASLIRRTIRAGQVVQCPSHVTIIGDVNPGAKVVAGGDMIVWGKLRGTVHAGAGGDDTAIIGALVLVPTQLRIGNHIARAPDDEPREPAVPEIARVDEKGIVVEPWNVTKR